LFKIHGSVSVSSEATLLKPAAVSFGRELSGSVEQLMDGSGPSPQPPFLKEIFDIEIIVWSKNVEIVRCEVIVLCKHAWRQCCQLASLMNLLMPRLMFCVCNKMIQQVSFHHHNKRLLSMLKILNVNCLDVGIVYKIYSKILNLIKNNKNNIILVAF